MFSRGILRVSIRSGDHAGRAPGLCDQLGRIGDVLKMKRRRWLWLLLAASSGCREASAPHGGGAPIQTDAAGYQLEAGSTGYAATIAFVFTNPRHAPVYVVN